MKAKLFKTMLCAGMAGALLTGCMDNNDVYNPDAVKKQFEQNWEKQFGKIDPNQTWNTAKRVTANVSLHLDALSDYVCKIYTSNPYTDSNAKLLAKSFATTDANGKANISTVFDAPISAAQVFVACENKHNRSSVRIATIENNEITTSFSSKGVVTKGSVDTQALPTMEAPYTEARIKELLDDEDTWDLSKEPNNVKYIDSNGQEQTLWNIWTFGQLGLITKGKCVAKVTNSVTYHTSLECDYNYYSPNLNSGVEAPVDLKTGERQMKIVIGKGGVFKPASYNPNIRGIDIIVAEGGILDLSCKTSIGNKARIIVMKGGKVVDAEGNTRDYFDHNGGFIYNAGEIEVQAININNAGIYNAPGATLTLKKELYFSASGENDVLTNYGTIIAPKIGGNGCQGTINNGCNIDVEDIQANYFNLGVNSLIDCNSLTLQGGITMRENSMLKVNDFKVNNAVAGEQGLSYVGATDGKAIICAKKISQYQSWQYKNGNNVWMEVGGFDLSDGSSIKTAEGVIKNMTDNGVHYTTDGRADVYIPADTNGCNKIGYGDQKEEENPKPLPEEPNSWILACEDLGNADDFDFNDVVFSVAHAAGSTDAYVTPLAAGGTLNAEIFYNNESLGEIHKLLGGDEGMMINTSSKGSSGDKITIKVPADFSLASNDMGGFSIIVTGKWKDKDVKETAQKIEAPVMGAAPQMICVPGDWAWPTERTNISEAYPGFGEWGKDYNTNQNWYANPNQDYIVK